MCVCVWRGLSRSHRFWSVGGFYQLAFIMVGKPVHCGWHQCLKSEHARCEYTAIDSSFLLLIVDIGLFPVPATLNPPTRVTAIRNCEPKPLFLPNEIKQIWNEEDQEWVIFIKQKKPLKERSCGNLK